MDLSGGSDFDAADCPTCGKDSCEGHEAASVSHLADMETLPDFVARVSKLPPPRLLLGELIPDDAITLIHGQPRAKKTLFYLDALLAMSTATAACGLPRLKAEEPVPVGFLCEEDAERRVCERIAWLLRGRGLKAPPSTFRLSVRRGVSLDNADCQDWIVRQLTKHGTRHLGLDPFRGLTLSADQGPDKLAPVAAFLRRVQNETRCKSLALIHHDTKPMPKGRDERERAQRASGGGIFSIADAPLHFQMVTRLRSLVVPNSFKFSADPEPFAFDVEHDDPLTSLRLVGTDTTEAEAEEHAVAGKVLTWIARNPGLATARVKEGVGGNRQAVVDALARLEDEGRIRHEPGKNAAKFWHVGGSGGG